MLRFRQFLRAVVSLCVASAVLGLLAGRCPAAIESEYARLRFLPHQTPDVYLQFQGKWLCVAASAEGLGKAKPIRALPSRAAGGPQHVWSHYAFPEVDLPISLTGADKASASFMIYRPPAPQPAKSRRPPRGSGDVADVEPSLYTAEVHITRRGASGAAWRYSIRTGGEPVRSDSPDDARILDIPSVDSLTLAAEATGGEKLAIGVRVTAGPHQLYDLRRDGDPRLVSVRVLDRDGDVVVSETGDLEKFGFT